MPEVVSHPPTANEAGVADRPPLHRPGRILASPVAGRLAQEHGLDLASIRGSGPEGQIQKRDVLLTIEAMTRLANTVPLSPMRREIARRTRQSKTEIPHFYAGITVDMSEAVRLRGQMAAEARETARLPPTLNDLIVLAAARALRQIPELNSSWHDERITRYTGIDLGVALAVEGGVLTPVIRGANRCDVFELAEITARLRERVAAGKLTADELTGGALTVSNLGMFGLDWFVAIINPPQAATVAVGAVRSQPAVVEGRLAIRDLMEVTLSVDHRLVDGVSAARFLNEFRRRLEAPQSLLAPDRNAEAER